MIICLDIGNTHIYGGVFINSDIKLRFRYPSSTHCTSDVFGLFLKDVLEKNQVDLNKLKGIVISSVVPALDYSVVAACKKYFSITPLELKPGIKTGLKLQIKNPLELGADRIANTIAAIHHFPKRNLFVVDFGTATTVCAISKEKAYIGGAILPGFKLSMAALSQNAAKLSAVDILLPDDLLGKTTEAQLQLGLYYGQLGAIKEITKKITLDAFQDEEPLLISTGGYAQLYENENYFAVNIPDLVLHGLRLVWEKNKP
jgi:type III pantothenate kinase